MRCGLQRSGERATGPVGAARRRAQAAGETPRTLGEIDYLLMVNDAARQGALRFALEAGGPFLAAADDTSIPPLVDLARLLNAADRVGSDSESDEDLRLLLAPGSSLGGARRWGTRSLGDPGRGSRWSIREGACAMRPPGSVASPSEWVAL